jgi:hypothetical protein
VKVHIWVLVFEICLELLEFMELAGDIKLGLDHLLDPRGMIDGGSRSWSMTLQPF